MLLPSAFYAHGEAIAQHLPHLRPSQLKGLALWVGGTILARSSCQNAVLGALLTLGLSWHATRPYLREWLHDEADRAAPCRVPRDVDACFAPLLRWVLAWWEDTELTLAIDLDKGICTNVLWLTGEGYEGMAGPVHWEYPSNQTPACGHASHFLIVSAVPRARAAPAVGPGPSAPGPGPVGEGHAAGPQRLSGCGGRGPGDARGLRDAA